MEETIKEKVELSTEEIVKKVQDDIKSSWSQILSMSMTDELTAIVNELKRYTKEGRKWVPGAAKMLRWMKVCPYDKIKAVIITDAYSNLIGYHTGIPLQVEPIKDPDGKVFTPKPSVLADLLQYIMTGVTDKEKRNYDLRRWCEQGVLIMPTSSTARINGINHEQLWKGWNSRIVEQINKKGDIPIILLKERTHYYKEMLTSKYVRTIKTKGEWTPDVGTWINEKITENKRRKPIEWIEK